jgi:hypothetical protein
VAKGATAMLAVAVFFVSDDFYGCHLVSPLFAIGGGMGVKIVSLQIARNNIVILTSHIKLGSI